MSDAQSIDTRGRPEPTIAILGGGPAGATVAMGLHRLGYAVLLITVPRVFDAVEGFSERVLSGLRNAGFGDVVDCVGPASPRRAEWCGMRQEVNSERLVLRSALDEALLHSLRRSGVPVLLARVKGLERERGQHRIKIDEDGRQRVLLADFVVEARGRSAPFADSGRVRGPETLCLLQRWDGLPLQRQSAVQSFKTGWAWCAALENGPRYLQVAVDVHDASLPPKDTLPDFVADTLEGLDVARTFLENARPVGSVVARASTSTLAGALSGRDWVRVGDAAMAVDPLSGNGTFQALSSALQTPAVINTLLRRPADAEFAHGFHRDRVEHLFHRFARIGRDFYRMEVRWQDAPFWRARNAWPDSAPTHVPATPGAVRCEPRPVICGDFIEMREVVVTPDQPLGIWFIDGLELAPVITELQRTDKPLKPDPLAWIRRRFAVNEHQAQNLVAWLHMHGLCG